MIIAKNLKKVYAPKKGVKVSALDDVSLKLPDTGMVFILGKSGSGKSTLLNVLGGLDSFDSGEIIIKDQSSKDFKQSHFDSYRNTYVGFIFQEYNILEEFTVGANIALAIELQGRKATNEEINQILAEVDLAGLGSRKPNELSGGQKQRVAIARALVKKPEIIMADEPTGALDSNTGRQVFDTLKELSKTKLVLIVSHDREFSELYADRIIELADGKIISDVEYDASASKNIEEPNLSFSGKEITIKDGYQLTEDDIVSINQYIKKVKSGATLLIDDKRRNKIFKKTDENSITHKVGDTFRLIKSKLSLKNAFKLGSSGLKHKKFRLVFTILLSFIAFSLFGLADVIASYNSMTTCTNSLMDSGIDYASFVKEIKRKYGEDDFGWERWGNRISSQDLVSLKESTGTDYIGVLGGDSFHLEFDNQVASNANSNEHWENVFPRAFSGVAPLTQSLTDEFGYNLIGKVPTEDNQIVITKYVAENFVKQGYIEFSKEDSSSKVVNVPSAQNMIGKKLRLCFIDEEDYEIVGIIDTGFDVSRYETLATTDDNGIWGMALYEELQSAQRYSLHSVVFTTPKLATNLSEFAQTNQQNVSKGEFRLVKYKYDDMGFDEGDNYINGNGYNSIRKLSSISPDKIAWFGEAQTSLLENQVIIPYSQLSWYKTDEGEGFDFSSIPLVGFEEEIAYKCGYSPDFGSFMSQFKEYIAYNYATNESNWSNVEKALKQLHNTDSIDNYFTTWDEEKQENVFDKEQAIYSFVWNIPESRYVPSNYYETAKVYYNQMLERYPEAKKHIIDFDTYLSSIIKLPNNMGAYYTLYSLEKSSYQRSTEREIPTLKFAVEKFPDAFEAAKKAETKPSWFEESADERYAFSRFRDAIDSLYWSDTSDDFSQDFINEYRKLLRNAELSTLSPERFGKIAISYRTNGSDSSVDIRNAKIVGVIFDSECMVVTDSIYESLTDPVAEGEFSYAVAPMPKDRNGVETLVDFYYNNSFHDGNVRFKLENSVASELSMIDELLEILGQVFLYVGLGFALFAALMLSNFIATSISYKKQEIGILRAIGSRSRDVFMIFFAESFIIAMINFVLSIVTTGVIVAVINNIFREDVGLLITFLNFGIRQIVLLLGVSLIVALIATFLPVKKIASMKPIDAIKNRK